MMVAMASCSHSAERAINAGIAPITTSAVAGTWWLGDIRLKYRLPKIILVACVGELSTGWPQPASSRGRD